MKSILRFQSATVDPVPDRTDQAHHSRYLNALRLFGEGRVPFAEVVHRYRILRASRRRVRQ